MLLVFFFKHKTAYEMRISDWSSDVCSSDLAARALEKFVEHGRPCGPAARDARRHCPRVARAAIAAAIAVVIAARAPGALALVRQNGKAPPPPCQDRHPVFIGGRTEKNSGKRDRKSTRLNSSH